MSDPHATVLPPRRASLAVLLSCFGSGIGHVYAGRPGKGLALYALELVTVPLLFGLALLRPSNGVLCALLALVVFLVALYGYAIVSAARAARRTEVPCVRGPYQRAPLYALLIFVGVGWAVGGTLLVREYAFEAFYVPSPSMEPTLQPGDRILVNKMCAGEIDRDDLVVFRSPEKPGQFWIKRVRGLPGDVIDGEAIPAGRVYLLGDNAANSRDSRHFGTVSRDAIVGVAEYVYWSRDPLHRLGLIR